MKYRITSICIRDGHVQQPTHPNFDSEGRRTEVIDTETNPLFQGCVGPWDVEDAYEAFWNRLNESWEHHFPVNKERVKVLKIEEIK